MSGTKDGMFYTGHRIIYNSGEQPTHTISQLEMRDQNQEKYTNLCQKYFGYRPVLWASLSIEDTKAFLSEFLEKKVTLCKVEEIQDSQYGFWVCKFHYKDNQ